MGERTVIKSILFSDGVCKECTIDYTNHRGERKKRMIVPYELWFGESPYHSGPQMFLNAYDFKRNEERDFAINGIHGVE
jgi:predicted DNA-binding transcriptional regulator YafY